MTPFRVACALIVGAYLGAAPFLRYAHLGAELVPHGDHAARHGGELVMVGDHHLELVRRGDAIEAFVSDAVRRPVRPLRAEASFDGGDPIPLHWVDRRLRTEARSSRTLRLTVELYEARFADTADIEDAKAADRWRERLRRHRSESSR